MKAIVLTTIDTPIPGPLSKSQLAVATSFENSYTFRVIANGTYVDMCRLARIINGSDWNIE